MKLASEILDNSVELWYNVGRKDGSDDYRWRIADSYSLCIIGWDRDRCSLCAVALAGHDLED